MISNAIISTAANKKLGMGHFQRSLWLAKIFQNEFSVKPFFLINPHSQTEEILRKEKISFKTIKDPEEEKNALEQFRDSLLIVDKRDTDYGFYSKFPFLSVGIDNHGKDSQYFDYVIQPLPFRDSIQSNLDGPQYLIFPDSFWNYQQQKIIRPVKKILASFGESDPADLSYLIYELFQRIKETYVVQIVLGPFYEGKLKNIKSAFPHIKITPAQTDLYQPIHSSDMVITHFGLTAYESNLLGTPVFLLNPDSYHQGLTQKSDFPNAGVGSAMRIEEIREKLVKFISRPFFAAIDGPSKGNYQFKTALKQILNKKKSRCPVCSEYGSKAVFRRELDNIYFCEKDRLFFRNADYECQTINYGTNYFVEDYQKQYGKTYEEDRANIDKLNRPRLDQIIRLIKKTDRKQNLLEIGCALGFFLDMARKTNLFDTEGIEISNFAVNYAKYKLNLKVEQGDFLSSQPPYPYYDVLSMWYYIEHNQDIHSAIKKIKESLKIGGILALSTPNGDGISSRKNRTAYAEKIPGDHYFEFSPAALKTLLAKEGFKMISLRFTGVHPARWFKNCPKFLYPLLRFLMKKLHLGDTFEAYFRRVR